MRALPLMLCVVVLAAAAPAYSKISVVTLEELTRSSDQIVTVKVTDVTRSQIESRVVLHAKAMVLQTLKGPPLTEIQFVAYPAGPDTMDSTEDAVVGETALLFLYKGDDGTYGIKQAGRGRMPIRQVGGKTYATLWDDVLLPESAPAIPGPEPKYSFIVSVELSYLEKLIKNFRHLTRAP